MTPGIGLLIVVEQVCGKDHVLNHLSIPAACFTHPEISMVGLTEVSYAFTNVVSSACELFLAHMLRYFV